VVDPIEEVGAIALEHGIDLHVDGSLGGVVLPYWRIAGHKVPEFDFAVPGVTSISVELHKFGYAPPGVAAILYRTEEHLKFQQWTQTDWLMGTYQNRTLLGTHSGASVAASWAIMRYLGADGFMRATGMIWNATQRVLEGVNSMQDVYIVGKPDTHTFAIGTKRGDVVVLLDTLRAKGWFPSPRIQVEPPAIHVTLMPYTEGFVDAFLADLQAASTASLA